MKTKFTEAEILKEKAALQALVQQFYESKKESEEEDKSHKDFTETEEGKEALEEYLADTHKVGAPKEESDDTEEGKLQEELYIQNRLALDGILEAANNVFALYGKEDADAKKFMESAQGKRAVSKYLKEAAKLQAKNLQMEAENELKKDMEEDDDKEVELKISEEDEKNLEEFCEAIYDFIKKEAEEEQEKKDESEDDDPENKNESEGEDDEKKENQDDPEDETAKNESFAKRFLKSEQGINALREWTTKLKATGFRVSSKLDEALSKTGKSYKNVISGMIEEAFAKSPIMQTGLLNEAQGKEMTALISESVSEMANTVEEKIRKEMIEQCQNYINSDVLPSITETFDEKFVPDLKKEISEGVDKYLQYTALQIVEELSKGNLIVKSHKAQQLETFTEGLMTLIKDKLTIMPEQENEVERLSKKISQLREEYVTVKMENEKMANKLTAMRQENYVIANLPESFSEATKEKILGYASDVLMVECDGDFEKFKEAFDKACDEAAADEDEYEQDKKEEKSLREKFRKRESEEEPEKKDESEDDADKKDESEDEPEKKDESDDDKDDIMEAVMRLGGKSGKSFRESEDDADDDEKKMKEDDEEKIDEKIKRLGKK